MSAERSVSSVPHAGSLWAMRGNRMIHFTDFVYEGEKVDVYESVEAAEEETGPVVQMTVCRDEDDWWLE